MADIRNDDVPVKFWSTALSTFECDLCPNVIHKGSRVAITDTAPPKTVCEECAQHG